MRYEIFCLPVWCEMSRVRIAFHGGNSDIIRNRSQVRSNSKRVFGELDFTQVEISDFWDLSINHKTAEVEKRTENV